MSNISNTQFSFSNISLPQNHRLSLGLIASDEDKQFYLKSHNGSINSVNQLATEMKTHQHVGVIEGILPLLGAHEMNGQIYLVFPFVQKDLFDLIGKINPCELISNVLLPLLHCLDRLHRAGYVHADIKLENIRIEDKDTKKVYLADFGKAVGTGVHNPHLIGALSQHIPPDMTISPQLDIYSIGVIAFQLLFGADFIKKFQMAGRDFNLIPESKTTNPLLLNFISLATEPSAKNRFKSASHAIAFLEARIPNTTMKIEDYNLANYFEFYLECMRETFVASNRSTKEFEEFVGPWGEKYYSRLKKWLGRSQSYLKHLTLGPDLIGICEATVREDDSALISTIFVKESFRGKGAALNLESSVLEFFIFHQVEFAFLNVTLTNSRAISFYERQGWQKVEGSMYSNAFQFKKKLK